MSLSGIVNTHTIAACMIVHHGTEEQKRRLAAADGYRGAPRLPLAVGADAGSDDGFASARGPSATATST